MKKNKALSITLLSSVLAVAIVGISLGVFYLVPKGPNQIVFHTGTETMIVDETVMNEIEEQAEEVVAEQESNSKGISTYADGDGDGYDDETGEPIEDTGEDTTPVDSTTELVAKWIQVAFFNAAISGADNPNTEEAGDGWRALQSTPTAGSVYNPHPYGTVNPNTGEEDEWVKPHLVDPVQIRNAAIEINFYLNTTAAATPAYQYVGQLAQGSFEIAKVAGAFTEPIYQTMWDMKYGDFNNDGTIDDTTYFLDDGTIPGTTANDKINDYYQQLLRVTYETDVNFQLEILNFLYSYAYLWQETTGAFDYYITQKLFEQSYIMSWKYDVQNIKDITNGNKHWNDLLVGSANNTGGGIVDVKTTATSTDLGTDYKWASIADDNNVTGGSTVIKNQTFTDNRGTMSDTVYGGDWDYGFQGLQPKSASSLITDGSLWSPTNAFQWYESADESFSYTQFGKIGAQTLPNPQLYSEGGDTVQSTTGTDDTGMIYSVVMLYPFTFTENYNPADGTGDNWHYSMYAVAIDPTTGAELAKPTVYNDPAKPVSFVATTADNPNAFTIFDVMAAPDWNEVVIGDAIPYDAVTLELYLMLNYSKSAADTLTNQSYKYWNDRGFYIELSGDYEDKYGTLINTGLQKTE